MCMTNEAAAIKLAERDNLVGELVHVLSAMTDHLERIGDTRPHKDGQYIDAARAVIAKAREGAQS